jgi:glycosyltransferase involved in cell wall biosynthesis
MPTKLLLSGENILILSAGYWADNAVSSMQIAAHLSEKNKVVYVETIGGRFPKFSEFRKVFQRLNSFFWGAKYDRKVGLDKKNTFILSPIAIPYHNNKIINWINSKILLIQIRRILKLLDLKKPIIWMFSPRWESVAEQIDAKLIVFHCVDGLHTYDNSEQFKFQFQRVVKNSDLVFTPGIILESELKQINKFTYRIGHGCGDDHLNFKDEGLVPADLEGITKPRVVYAGTLANWVDYDLMIEVANKLPQISFLMIGYVHALAPFDKVKELLNLPNVFHLGYKNYSDLPLYYSNSDVGIIPYQADDEHITYSTPTKIIDYCAAGLPIISTRYPAAESLPDYVRCADNSSDFARAIEISIKQKTKNADHSRKTFSKQHSWKNQIEKMSNYIAKKV